MGKNNQFWPKSLIHFTDRYFETTMSKKTKSETIYRYDHIPGEDIDLEEEYEQIQSYRKFDESGNLVSEIAYSQDGSITDKIEYRYDQSGLLVETQVYGEDDEVLERKEVVRDNDGKIVRELTHYMDGSTDIQEYFYKDGKVLIGMEVKDDEGELEYAEKYFYEGDQMMKVERWDTGQELVFSQEDSYKNGLITNRKIWSSEEEEPYTIVIDFNETGKRVQELRYDSNDQLVERNNFEEDENGHVVRIVEENRQRKNTTEFTYDDKGNVLHQAESDLNGELNHEVMRVYNPDGDLILTTVEAVMKPSGVVRAYSLIFKREIFPE